MCNVSPGKDLRVGCSLVACPASCPWNAGIRCCLASLPRPCLPQALTKRAESRPSAAQLFQHPWVQSHYRQLLAEQAHPMAATAAMAAAATHTPELRRTISQPPSPSKSMPGDAAGLPASGAGTPTAVAAALAPFLPLSQAKMAHKVRLMWHCACVGGGLGVVRWCGLVRWHGGGVQSCE